MTLAKLALALEKAGRSAEALEKEEEATALAAALTARLGQNPNAHFTQGVVHLLAGEKEAAESAFAQAIQCDASLALLREQTERMLAGLGE